MSLLMLSPYPQVLLSWSGGPSSSSMVWQVLEGLSQDSAKRLRFVPGVIYVDGTCGHSSTQSPEMREPHKLSRGQAGDRGGFLIVLKGPWLKKVT